MASGVKELAAKYRLAWLCRKQHKAVEGLANAFIDAQRNDRITGVSRTHEITDYFYAHLFRFLGDSDDNVVSNVLEYCNNKSPGRPVCSIKSVQGHICLAVDPYWRENPKARFSLPNVRSAPLAPGDLVTVKGLSRRQDLNGLEGRITKLEEGGPENIAEKRLLVRIQTTEVDVMIKRENIKQLKKPYDDVMADLLCIFRPVVEDLVNLFISEFRKPQTTPRKVESVMREYMQKRLPLEEIENCDKILLTPWNVVDYVEKFTKITRGDDFDLHPSWYGDSLWDRSNATFTMPPAMPPEVHPTARPIKRQRRLKPQLCESTSGTGKPQKSSKATFKELSAETACADVSANQGNHNHAREILSRVLPVLETFRNDPEWAELRMNVGIVYHKIGESAKALKLLEQALTVMEIWETAEQSIVQENLGCILFELEEFPKSLQRYEKALAARVALDGPAALEPALMKVQIGDVHHKMREYKKSLDMYKEALSVIESTLGLTHPDVKTVLCNIGSVYSSMGSIEEALECYNRASSLYPPDEVTHLNEIREIIANLLVRQGGHEKALEIYEEVLRTRNVLPGDPESKFLDMARMKNNIAFIYVDLGRYLEAQKMWEDVRAWQTWCGEDTANTSENIRLCEQQLRGERDEKPRCLTGAEWEAWVHDVANKIRREEETMRS